jgi:hypothetical protein
MESIGCKSVGKDTTIVIQKCLCNGDAQTMLPTTKTRVGCKKEQSSLTWPRINHTACQL